MLHNQTRSKKNENNIFTHKPRWTVPTSPIRYWCTLRDNQCPNDEQAGTVAKLANLTVIAAPYQDNALQISYNLPGRSKLINLYRKGN